LPVKVLIPGQALNIDYRPQVCPALEFQQDEVPVRRGIRTGREGNNLDDRPAGINSFQNFFQLGGYEFRISHSSTNDVLIEKYVILRPAVPAQQLLAAQPGLDALLHYMRIHFRRNYADNTLSIFLSLQQSGHVEHRVTGDRGGSVLQPDKRVQVEVIVLSPPARGARFLGQAHQLSRCRSIDFVDSAQVPDVAQARPPRTGLQPADLRSRAEKLLGDIFDGQVVLVAKPPEPSA